MSADLGLVDIHSYQNQQQLKKKKKVKTQVAYA